jgi:hypothetical protein
MADRRAGVGPSMPKNPVESLLAVGIAERRTLHFVREWETLVTCLDVFLLPGWDQLSAARRRRVPEGR